jgi:hypothetical protein
MTARTEDEREQRIERLEALDGALRLEAMVRH